MPKITSSDGDLLRRLRDAALAVLGATIEDPQRRQRIDQLSATAALCKEFVYGYTSIDDPGVDADDEIINWTFGDVSADLGAAIWSLSSGFYKAAASNLRNALDLSVTCLYFQVRENTDPAARGWNRFYAEWDRGDRATPNWGEIKPILKRQPWVSAFDLSHNCNVVDEVHSFFGYLSAYTHGRAFTEDKYPVRAIETAEAHAPSFDVRQFEHVADLTLKTVGWICTIWQIAYPQILATEPLGPATDGQYDMIFSAHERGRQAMAYRADPQPNAPTS